MHKMVADKKWAWASEVAGLQSQTLCWCESRDTVYHNSIQAYLELPNPKDDNSMSVKQCMLIRYSRVCCFAQDGCAGFSKLALLSVPRSLGVVIIVSKPSSWGWTPQSCWKNNSTPPGPGVPLVWSLFFGRGFGCAQAVKQSCSSENKNEWTYAPFTASWPEPLPAHERLLLPFCTFPFHSFPKRWGSIIKPVSLDVQ